ncbi:hypothetical protein RND81_09G057800 [Saponaria officinalis]|uniref:Uncharacterized protein n=1 Tax=Saponaria officinalis TaxID=3572 RepID=A0AAW1IH63_SAPOF
MHIAPPSSVLNAHIGTVSSVSHAYHCHRRLHSTRRLFLPPFNPPPSTSMLFQLASIWHHCPPFSIPLSPPFLTDTIVSATVVPHSTRHLLLLPLYPAPLTALLSAASI